MCDGCDGDDVELTNADVSGIGFSGVYVVPASQGKI
jgi:hypothetical protein